MTINLGAGGNEQFIQAETITISEKGASKRIIDRTSFASTDEHQNFYPERLPDDLSLISLDRKFHANLYQNLSHWQFLNLNPYTMGFPLPQKRTGGQVHLSKDGSNIAEYLLNIYNLNKASFNGIIETLQYVLPYATDLQPAITSELERNVYLQLTESDFKVPGWLLSTGTLRVLALLAVLRHPTPPPLIVIEEIENGLDPRTIHLIVEEIRNAVTSGRSQIIITTHSPYLLDLLTISQIVMVERDSQGQPLFTRPADQKSLQEWTEQFSIGKLYTMGQLNQEGIS